MNKALLIGWIFLGIMLLLAVAAIILLLPGRERGDARPAATAAPLPAGSAFVTDQTAPPLTTEEGRGGRAVHIGGILCDYTEPGEVTVGVLRSVDLTALAETVTQNVRAAGWGEVRYTVSDNGSLLLYAADMPQLSGEDYEKQTAFLASSRPEDLARTFLAHSGLIDLLRSYGLTLSTAAENDGGEITFRGTGNEPGTECSVRFTFLFTGAFDQAVLRSTYLAGAVTTREVVKLERAAANAVSWNAGEEEVTSVTAVELRSIRGIPFYALTCTDGTVAYSLAVSEDVLDQVPGAREVYDQLLQNGIDNNVTPSGGE